MQQKGGIDVINMVLEDCILAFPLSSFVISLYQQYGQRGWLTKGQLQGLHDKASKIKGIQPGRLAALEAIIKRMPTRDRTPLPENKPMFVKNASAGETMQAILDKYPEHKRVIYLKAKYENNEPLSEAETTELQRFKKLLLK